MSVLLTGMNIDANPNPALERSRKKVLIVVSPIWEESAVKILTGIARCQRKFGGWEIQLDNEGLSLKDESWYTKQKWDGVISRHVNAFQVEMCRRLGCPLVDVNNARPFAGVPNVALNNVAIGQLGGEHLIDRGFSQFGFCGYSNLEWSLDRRKGFSEALAVTGRSCKVLESEHPVYESWHCTPDWQTREQEAIAAWLTAMPKPVGVMACNDFLALSVIAAAAHAGLRVPEDVAVLGANDDTIRCEMSHPPLSSVASSHVLSGYRAAEILELLMSGQSIEGMDLVVDPDEVVTRQSTDILAVEDKRIAAAVRFISQNACKGITVGDVLKHAGMARTQLEEKFRQCFGRSPQAEIRRVQLARIRNLLLTTDLPLRAISEIAGFAHPEYMIVFFKREVGESPGRYRRRASVSRSIDNEGDDEV